MDIENGLEKINKCTSKGCYQLECGDLILAKRAFIKAHRIAEHLFSKLNNSDTASLYITTSINLGGMFLAAKEPKQAIKWLDKGNCVYESQKDVINISQYYLNDMYINFASAHEQLGKWSGARKWLIKSLEISKQLIKDNQKDKITLKDVLELHLNLCKKYALLSEVDNLNSESRTKCWKSVAKSAISQRNKTDLLFSLKRMVFWGITQKEEDYIVETLRWTVNALQLVPNGKEKGSLLNEIGLELASIDKAIPEAVDVFKEALASSKTLGPNVQASILQNIGAAEAAQKAFNNAITSLEEACVLYGRISNRTGQAQAGCNLAYSLASAGLFDKARQQYTLAREAARDACLPGVQLQAEEALAALSLRRGRPDKAMRHLQAAIALCPALAAAQALQVVSLAKETGVSMSDRKVNAARRASSTAKDDEGFKPSHLWLEHPRLQNVVMAEGASSTKSILNTSISKHVSALWPEEDSKKAKCFNEPVYQKINQNGLPAVNPLHAPMNLLEATSITVKHQQRLVAKLAQTAKLVTTAAAALASRKVDGLRHTAKNNQLQCDNSDVCEMDGVTVSCRVVDDGTKQSDQVDSAEERLHVEDMDQKSLVEIPSNNIWVVEYDSMGDAKLCTENERFQLRSSHINAKQPLTNNDDVHIGVYEAQLNTDLSKNQEHSLKENLLSEANIHNATVQNEEQQSNKEFKLIDEIDESKWDSQNKTELATRTNNSNSAQPRRLSRPLAVRVAHVDLPNLASSVTGTGTVTLEEMNLRIGQLTDRLCQKLKENSRKKSDLVMK